jgi:hypothetical protein
MQDLVSPRTAIMGFSSKAVKSPAGAPLNQDARFRVAGGRSTCAWMAEVRLNGT